MFHRDEDPAIGNDWVRDEIAEIDAPLLSERRHQARRGDRTGMRSVDLERARLFYRGLSRRRSREQNRDKSGKDDGEFFHVSPGSVELRDVETAKGV
jgi:hypothetical protein